MKRTFGLGLVLISASLSASSAHAFRLPNSSSCENDQQTYCLGLLAQGHAVLNKCLHDHYDKLSMRCKAQLDDERAKKAKTAAGK